MPRKSEHPKLRVHRKQGKDGQVWTSYFFDMRGTGHPDVALGPDRDAALVLWKKISDGALPNRTRRRTGTAQRPDAKPSAPTVGKRRNFDHAIWDAAPAWAKPMYLSVERRSREAARAVFLSPSEFLAVVRRAGGRCELTGIPFDATRHQSGKRAPFAPSLDRINCAQGYIAGNVRLVCIIVNCALGDFGEAAFERAAEAFLDARNLRRTPACGSGFAGGGSGGPKKPYESTAEGAGFEPAGGD